MKKIIFTVEQEQNIINYYLVPNSLLATAKFAGVKNVDIIKKILIKYQINFHTKETVTKIQQIKAQKTFIKKYGSKYICNSNYTKQKRHKTVKEKYGVDNIFQVEAIKTKIKETNLALYGVEHPLQNIDLHKKAIETTKQKYGTAYFNQSDKAKLINLATFGVANYTESAEFKAKRLQSLKVNNTFNSSRPEEILYQKLVACFGNTNVIRQYNKDSRYPFACDFYIKSLDFFIELNLHWSHGGHLFNSQNQDDILKLHLWQEKAKKSLYYKNAIETWTLRDTTKYKLATLNSLKYYTIYTRAELYNFMKTIETGCDLEF